MKNFIYDIPTKIYFGKDQLDNLGQELIKYGQNLLLVYGGESIKRNGLYDKVIFEINKYHLNLFELNGIKPNPRIEEVKKGSLICKENKIDFVLAVGGGSVIDTAKFICANALDDVNDPYDYFLNKAKITKALPLITISTISGSASEMNGTGVLSNEKEQLKLSASSQLLRPVVSFLDPTITYSVSRKQTAYTSADILSHLIEVYFNLNADFYMLRRIGEAIMKTVIKYGPVALNEPDNYEARANLMWASSWAHNGFLKAGDAIKWSCHAIEHELSAIYDIPHGLGLAIITPKWLEYCLNDQTIKIYVEFGTNVFNIDSNLDDMTIAKQAIEKLKQFLYDDLQLCDNLTELGIKEIDFPIMAKKACKGGILNSFIPLNQNDIEEILRRSK